ncbi:hypothetical protein [Exiguobacterium sp. JLM-2]|uniref:hypothetical protein n=1 Tax=Exiguobacterium sp. JLM-2 TaxID=1647415 RepID=UPI00064A638F|nr:hypothetical protein [Exiguobacterium sp. JLM-2]
MNEEIKYGEIKVRKNIFPRDARKLVKKESVGILLSQCKVSDKTKAILDEKNIVLYEGVEPNEVVKLKEEIKELLHEKNENERE